MVVEDAWLFPLCCFVAAMTSRASNRCLMKFIIMNGVQIFAGLKLCWFTKYITQNLVAEE